MINPLFVIGGAVAFGGMLSANFWFVFFGGTAMITVSLYNAIKAYKESKQETTKGDG